MSLRYSLATLTCGVCGATYRALVPTRALTDARARALCPDTALPTCLRCDAEDEAMLDGAQSRRAS
jgi:hypothetical protein